MTFTDDDLKRLKEHIRLGVDPRLQIEGYEALLARLEASENANVRAQHLLDRVDWKSGLPGEIDNLVDALKVWRKACGK